MFSRGFGKVVLWLGSIVLLTTSLLVAANVGDARKATNKAFKKTSFTAMLGLKEHGKLHVRPDGSPILDGKLGKRQSRFFLDVAAPGYGTKFKKGATGNMIVVRPGRKEVTVSLSKKQGLLVNPTHIIVHYNRRVEASDITPEKIAIAVSAVIEIDAYPVSAAIDQTLAAPSTQPVPERTSSGPRATGSSLVFVQVSVDPERVHPGDQVSLDIAYGVDGPEDAIETRMLYFDGELLPSYPEVDKIPRTTGQYQSRYEQLIPSGASPGHYLFKGEVCVRGDCVSRSTQFEVVR